MCTKCGFSQNGLIYEAKIVKKSKRAKKSRKREKFKKIILCCENCKIERESNLEKNEPVKVEKILPKISKIGQKAQNSPKVGLNLKKSGKVKKKAKESGTGLMAFLKKF